MRKILPPTFLLVCLLLMLALRWLLPLQMIFPPLVWLLGIGLMGLGFVLSVLGEQQFHKAHTPVNPLETPQILVTNGLYRWTRNPMYLGFALVLLGVWLMLGALSPLMGVLLFVVVTDRWYIAGEEKRLEVVFGQVYLDYTRQVRRWI
jgi:protein-S-isoprenylcysteine O-methyltransferase Ste14